MPNGKRNLRIYPNDVDHLELRNDEWKASPFEAPAGAIVKNWIPIPCGQCLGCRMDYSRHWADRLMLEYKMHDEDTCWFLTLTYADESLELGKHIHYYADPETGEVSAKSLSLYKRDLQRFWKLLRYYHPDDELLYFAAGEYGSLNHRPHYHAIVFGLHLDPDKVKPDGVSKSGLPQWTCDDVSKAWIRTRKVVDRVGKRGKIYYKTISEPLGKVWLGKVSWNSCAYVARYCTKKVGANSRDYYESFNIDPEFTVMSKCPAIGRSWFELHSDDYASGRPIFVPDGRDDSKRISSVRYFDKLMERDAPEDLQRLKNQRSRSAQIVFDNKSNGDKTYQEQLDTDREVFEARFRHLKREL